MTNRELSKRGLLRLVKPLLFSFVLFLCLALLFWFLILEPRLLLDSSSQGLLQIHLHGISFFLSAFVIVIFIVALFFWWLISGSTDLLDRSTSETDLIKELDQLNKKLKDEIKLNKAYEEALCKSHLEIDLRQRKKIAAELHDNIGQSLQYIKLEMNMVMQQKEEKTVVNERLQQLVSEVELCTLQLREMLTTLRPSFLDSMNILEAIQYHGKKISASTNLKITVSSNIDEYKLDQITKEYCFLIYQEILSNIVKHADATEVNITLSRTNNQYLSIEIIDNGLGFDPALYEHSGQGVSLIKERARDIGGTLSITSAHNNGTKIMLKAPLK